MANRKNKVLKKGAVKTVKGKKYKLNKNSRWTRYLPEVATAGALATWGITSSTVLNSEIAANAHSLLKARKFGAKPPVRLALGSTFSYTKSLLQKRKLAVASVILGGFVATKAVQLSRKAKREKTVKKSKSEIAGLALGAAGLIGSIALMNKGVQGKFIKKIHHPIRRKIYGSVLTNPKAYHEKTRMTERGWETFKKMVKKQGGDIKISSKSKDLTSASYGVTTGTIYAKRRSPVALHEYKHFKQLGFTGRDAVRTPSGEIVSDAIKGKQTLRQRRYLRRGAQDADIFGIEPAINRTYQRASTAVRKTVRGLSSRIYKPRVKDYI